MTDRATYLGERSEGVSPRPKGGPRSAARRGRTLFVTGTDTGVGKTLVSCALLRLLKESGIKVCGFKPVASGCERTAKGLRNADALALQRAAGTRETYERINPYAFEPPIAPHLAAAQAGSRIQTTRLREAHDELAARYELIVAEGAGGWRVPLDEAWTMAEWVAEQEWPVILVVGMRLGCINHALLTAEAITRGTRLLGWVANALPPEQEALQGNIETLRAHLSAPLLGIIPASATAGPVDRALDLQPVLKLLTQAAPRDA
jgi:dethiobiotin synthetase